MKKSELEFLEILEQRAREQRRLINSGLLPSWAGFMGAWFAVHPWRVIAPVAGVIYVLARLIFGAGVVELTLGLFGGFR